MKKVPIWPILIFECFLLLKLSSIEAAQASIDVGIRAINIPNAICSSSTDVMVAFGNYNAVTITSATFNWTVNGQPQSSYYWTGNQLGYSVSPVFKLGQITPLDNNPITVSVTISDPNNGTDPDLTNNTWTLIFRQGLKGTYTVGGESPDFTDIITAAKQLNEVGVCGPVTFNIRDGIYSSGMVFLETVPGASANNAVIFQSESHEPEAVSITGSNGTQIWIHNTSHITLKELSVVGNSDKLIAIDGNSTYVSLIDNIIATEKATATGVEINSSGISHSIFQGNRIEGGAKGLTLLSDGNPQYSSIVGNEFINNSSLGIYLQLASDVTIRQNKVSTDHANSSYHVAIKGSQISNCEISDNKIDTYETGLDISGNKSTIINNFIHIKDDGRDAYPESIGVYISLVDSKILHNTIVTEDASADSEAMSVNFFSSQIINNILVNKGGGVCLKLLSSNSNSSSHHNNFFTTGTNLFAEEISPLTHHYFTSLEEYTTNTGFEKRSVSIDPEFINSSDLHAQSEGLIGIGYPTSVTTDIDGQLRDALTPTLGADEFGQRIPLDLCVYNGAPMDLCSPTSLPQIVVKNTGMATINSFQVKWSLNGLPEKTETWTGALASGEEVLYSISDVYTFDELQAIHVEVQMPNNAIDTRPFYNATQLKFTRYAPVDLGPQSQTLCLPNGNPSVNVKPTQQFEYYRWTNGATTPSIDINTDGYYGLSAKDFNNCTSYDNIIVQLVTIAPTLIASGDNEFCVGETKLVVIKTPTACDGCLYNWYRDNELISDATGVNYTTEVGGSITASVTRLGCIETTPAIAIIQNSLPPKPILQVSKKDICKGETATIVAPYGYVNYYWSPYTHRMSVNTDTTGTWVLTVTDGKCFIESDSVTITVHDRPEFYLLVNEQLPKNNNVNFCEGMRIRLRAVTNSAGTANFTWAKNNETIRGVTSSSMEITSAGNYSVTQFSSYCSSSPSSVFISIDKIPEPQIRFEEGELLATGCDTYQWFLDGRILSGKTQPSLHPEVSGRYYVEGKKNNNCTALSSPIDIDIDTDIDVLITAVGDDVTSATRCYPNPARDYIYVELPPHKQKAGVNVKIHNALGQEFKPISVEVNKKGFLLNIQNFTPGIYFLHFQNTADRIRPILVIQ